MWNERFYAFRFISDASEEDEIISELTPFICLPISNWNSIDIMKIHKKSRSFEERLSLNSLMFCMKITGFPR